VQAKDMIQKLQYLLWAGVRRWNSETFRCVNCGSDSWNIIDRKYFVTVLVRCSRCRLMYRAPTDDARANFSFYQGSYRQAFVSEIPDSGTLETLVANRFIGSPYDHARYISVLRSLGLPSGARIFDFGCSWGYGSWQLIDAGFEVSAFEISQSRAEFARSKLGINCISTWPAIEDGSLDCFFTAHVLEHVPSPSKVISLARRALKPGGYFVAFTPNGNEEFRKLNPVAWRMLWGQVHPNFIDDKFYKLAFASDICRTEGSSDSELLCVAKIKP
jgi:2-polyprenyl-3-methyl-5-hydroxy-6-metoxy-1,4-benzoquinol methylase